jgi:hypothetical protein
MQGKAQEICKRLESETTSGEANDGRYWQQEVAEVTGRESNDCWLVWMKRFLFFVIADSFPTGSDLDQSKGEIRPEHLGT